MRFRIPGVETKGLTKRALRSPEIPIEKLPDDPADHVDIGDRRIDSQRFIDERSDSGRVVGAHVGGGEPRKRSRVEGILADRFGQVANGFAEISGEVPLVASLRSLEVQVVDFRSGNMSRRQSYAVLRGERHLDPLSDGQRHSLLKLHHVAPIILEYSAPHLPIVLGVNEARRDPDEARLASH